MRAKRVAAVLRVRRLQEQRARGELAVGNAELRRATAHEHAAIEEVAARGEQATEVHSPLDLQREHDLIEAGFGIIGARHIETEQRADEARELMQSWTEAARRVDALERLEGRIEAADALEADRVERAEVDDLAAERHRRRTVPGVTTDHSADTAARVYAEHLLDASGTPWEERR